MVTQETPNTESQNENEVLTIRGLDQLRTEIDRRQFDDKQKKAVEVFIQERIKETGEEGLRVTRGSLNKLLAEFELHKTELEVPEHLRSVYEAWKKKVQAPVLTGIALKKLDKERQEKIEKASDVRAAFEAFPDFEKLDKDTQGMVRWAIVNVLILGRKNYFDGKHVVINGVKDEALTEFLETKGVTRRFFLEAATELVFMDQAVKSGDVKKVAEDIAKKYNISLEGGEGMVRTQIATNKNIGEPERTFLLFYITNAGEISAYAADLKKANDEQSQKEQNLPAGAARDATEQMRKKGANIPAGVELSGQELGNAIRNPMQFIGKYFSGMNPFSALATVGLLVWGLFGKPFDSKFGYVLTAMAGYGALESLKIKGQSMVDHAAGYVENKMGNQISWAFSVMAAKGMGAGKELAERISMFYNFHNHRMSVDENGKKVEKDIMDVPFNTLRSHVAMGQIDKTVIWNEENKAGMKLEEVQKLRNLLDEYIRIGQQRVGPDFLDRIGKLSVIEVLDVITDNNSKTHEKLLPAKS